MPAFFATTLGKIVIACVAIALVLGGFYLIEKTWSDSISEARKDGDKAGYDRARKEISEEQNKLLAAANKRIKDLEDEARVREQQAAQDVADARVEHQKEVADAKAKASAALAANRRLRDRAASCGGSPGSDGTQAQAAANPAGGAQLAAGCELSGRATAGLQRLAERADETRAVMKLCQSTLLAYKKECE